MDMERFRRIRTLHDIKIEKARLRYESLVAENAMMDSVRAVGSLFSLVRYIRKVSAGFGTAFAVASRITRFTSGIFSRSKPETGGDGEETVSF